MKSERIFVSSVVRRLFVGLSLLTLTTIIGRCTGGATTLRRRRDYQNNDVTFIWRETDFSSCSVTCGTGVESTDVVCFDSAIDQPVSDDRCQFARRPARRSRTCVRLCVEDYLTQIDHQSAEINLASDETYENLDSAGRRRVYAWVVDEWGPCSKSCGTDGVRLRPVRCVGESDDGRSLVPTGDDRLCDAIMKPAGQQDCPDLIECPIWIAGQWSLCSTTCGTGYQLRAVVCRHADNRLCPVEDQPPERRPCRSRVPCFGQQLTTDDEDIEGALNGDNSDNYNNRHLASTGIGWILDPLNRNLHDTDWRGEEVAESSQRTVHHRSLTRGAEVDNDAKKTSKSERTRSVTIHSSNDILSATSPDVDNGDVTIVRRNTSHQAATDRTDQSSSSRVYDVSASDSHEFDRSKYPVIDADTSDFVQLRRLDVVPLVVGGTATVIAGTSIYIQCPVALHEIHLNDSMADTKVVWGRLGKHIATGRNAQRQRIGVNRRGVLRVRHARQSDAGVYTCSTGSGPGQQASTTVQFHTASEAQTLTNARRVSLDDEGSDGVAERIEVVSAGIEPFEHQRGGDLAGGSYSIRHVKEALRGRLPAVYVTSSWSRCSVRCGFIGGMQTRNATCSLLGDGWALDIDESNCALDRQLERPKVERDCNGLDRDCTTWMAGNWSQCSDDSCSSLGVGIRRRSVHCASQSSGERVDDGQCDVTDRPVNRDKCPHNRCRTTWMTSSWTKCTGECGRPGVKTRSATCVWGSRKKPAGNQCFHLPRPTLYKPCLNSPCSSERGVSTVCRDESKNCQLIAVLLMCRYPQYQTGCCRSCRQFATAAAGGAV